MKKPIEKSDLNLDFIIRILESAQAIRNSDQFIDPIEHDAEIRLYLFDQLIKEFFDRSLTGDELHNLRRMLFHAEVIFHGATIGEILK